MLRKNASRIVLTLLLIAVSVSSLPVHQVKSPGLGVGQPIPVGLPVFRGGTFGFFFTIWLSGWPGDNVSVAYEFSPSLDPLVVTWDPEPPATIPDETDTRIYFNLTVPVDATLGAFSSNLHVITDGGAWVPFQPGPIDVLRAEVDFDPTFVYIGEEHWVYCYIEPPESTSIFLGVFRSGASYKTIDYTPHDINVSTVRLNNSIPAEPSFAEVSDFDGDGMFDLKVAFNRSDVENFILDQGITSNIATLNVTGQFEDGWAFAGSNQVEVAHELTVTSWPITGIPFNINGDNRTTPHTDWFPQGSYTLEMPETYDGYIWSHWLEDGDTNRTRTHVLTGNTTWTGVFTILGDVNGDGIVDIHDVVIAALAFGSYPGHPRWNPQADLNNDGIIDIFDLVIIGINYGKTA